MTNNDVACINCFIGYQQTPSKLMHEKLNELLFHPFEMNANICEFNKDEYMYMNIMMQIEMLLKIIHLFHFH